MTDPIVSLETDHLSVEPGGQVSVTVRITNPGTIVEGYRIEVVGEGVAGWSEVLPPDVSVYPKQDGTAVVVFSPPGGTGAPGGTWPFGVRVRSTEDDDASAVAEGDLEIGKVFGLQAKLVPVNSSGRWRGRHVVQLSNWGNAPAKISLTASNPDDALAFMIRPEVVELPLGGTANAMVWVKTKKPFLRGTPARLPFTITGEQPGAAPQQGPALPYGGTPDRPTVDGALNQKPILSRGAVMVAALALLAVGGGIAWALTRPPPAEATFRELGPPPQPKNVKVAAASPESANVQWDPVADVDGYTIVQEVDGAQTNDTTAKPTENLKTIAGLTPGTHACFKVRADRGQTTPGPFSDPACVDLPAAASTASPTAGGPTTGGPSATATGSSGQPTDSVGSSNGTVVVPPPPPGSSASASGSTGQQGSPGSSTVGGPETTGNPAFKGLWFGVSLWPGTTAEGTVTAKSEALKAKNAPSGVALGGAYPHITTPNPLASDTWILYLGPFDSRDKVLASCQLMLDVQADCLPVQLDP